MSGSRTEADSSNSAILAVDTTPNRKRRLINDSEDVAKELAQGAEQNGGLGMALNDETNEFNDDSHLEECHEESTEVVMIDQQTELMKKEFHANIYGTLPRRYPDLAFINAMDENDRPVLVVTHRGLFYHPPFGFTSRIQITLHGYSYVAHVLMIEWKSGVVQTSEEAEDLFDKFTDKASYKFCQGIDPDDYYKEYYEAIRFHIKSVRQVSNPFAQVDSVKCKLWFLVAHNASEAEKKAKEV